MGVEVEPYKYLDKFVNPTIPPPNAIAFDKNIQYATLSECKEQWTSYATKFMAALKSVDDSILTKEIPFTVLIGGNTVEDALAFIIMHESYHIGQMSVLRKSLGYPSMQLSPRK